MVFRIKGAQSCKNNRPRRQPQSCRFAGLTRVRNEKRRSVSRLTAHTNVDNRATILPAREALRRTNRFRGLCLDHRLTGIWLSTLRAFRLLPKPCSEARGNNASELTRHHFLLHVWRLAKRVASLHVCEACILPTRLGEPMPRFTAYLVLDLLSIGLVCRTLPNWT